MGWTVVDQNDFLSITGLFEWASIEKLKISSHDALFTRYYSRIIQFSFSLSPPLSPINRYFCANAEDRLEAYNSGWTWGERDRESERDGHEEIVIFSRKKKRYI